MPCDDDKRVDMMNRRIEPRLLCADLVDIQWKDDSGRVRRDVANLEDISLSGACLQVERPVPLGTAFRITYPKGVLSGKVKYCVFREVGYFLGIEFAEGTRWSKDDFRPQHLLDPRSLLERAAKNKRQIAPESAA